jgi:hypothetical protein
MIADLSEIIIGAGGRNRTDMELPPEDFESSASTSFTTPARPQSNITGSPCQGKRLATSKGYQYNVAAMLTGYNTDFKFQGQVYHCQTEDGGHNNPYITSLMYRQGAILARRQTSYADILRADCLDDVVRELMMEQHKQMIRDLMQGTLETNVNAPPAEAAAAPESATPPAPAPAQEVKKAPPPPPMPEEIKEKSLDDIILEFLEQEDIAKK